MLKNRGMRLSGKKEVNTGRQFEFDFAKAVCILGMVFVHCFERIPLTASVSEGALYYSIVIVLDALFGAGTFMICLGVGLTYTNNNTPNAFIKRGLITLLMGYLLNFIRWVLPCCLFFLTDDAIETVKYLGKCFLFTDIMQFAGLSFLFFGLLKKFRIPDWGIATIALVMSALGSIFRFLDFGSVWINEILGLFIATEDYSTDFPYYATFALLNWFVFVVFGYFLGKFIRRCENTEKYYAISTLVSAIVVVAYMIVAIPNKLGMMSGDVSHYFQMTTPEALVIMMGAVFAFGLYHYLSKALGDKVKHLITGLSVNINKTYCIHWTLVGWISIILWIILPQGLNTCAVLIIALTIYVVSSVSAEIYRRIKLKRINKS